MNQSGFHVRKPEKEEQFKSEARRRKEIIEIRVEINEIENRKTRTKSMKQKLGL